ncbi:CPBP family intramembrane glutamic endopeptidase [uncultured Tessaracoccus sp.]|uniref:CPBP family intramembrane glutamic endopeptidase n=1 Tax=uncultured Tessaracoccus sp. TaxID=905023 RepID=UPI0026251E5D|nr:type II CAAX endopeptidase family protein [uncultured Tessaracoccus sp.]
MSHSSQPPTLLHRGAPEDPPSDVPYALALQPAEPFRAMMGILLAFCSYVVLLPVVQQVVLFVGARARGVQDFPTYSKWARAYEIPEGLLAGHLALASLTLVALAVARFVHGRAAKWTFSVQPGMRWRYLLATVLVAVVLLNVMLWASFGWQGLPQFNSGQSNAGWFVLVVLLSSPLQALAEEVFFRGYLMQAFGSMTGKVWVGVVASSLIFAFMHGLQNPALFTHRLAFGLVSGVLVLWTGGLEAGIAAHVVNNLGAFGYAIFTSSVAEIRAVREITWAKTGWDMLTFVLFALVAGWIARHMRLATRTP